MQNPDLGFIDIYLAGATGGIGQQIARQATERGANVINLVRSQDKAQQQELPGGTMEMGDIFDPNNQKFNDLLQRMTSGSYFINAAGKNLDQVAPENVDPKEWLAQMIDEKDRQNAFFQRLLEASVQRKVIPVLLGSIMEIIARTTPSKALRHSPYLQMKLHQRQMLDQFSSPFIHAIIGHVEGAGMIHDSGIEEAKIKEKLDKAIQVASGKNWQRIQKKALEKDSILKFYAQSNLPEKLNSPDDLSKLHELMTKMSAEYVAERVLNLIADPVNHQGQIYHSILS